MATITNWQRKVILLFRSEKRLNAGKIIKNFMDKSIDDMKATLITDSMCNVSSLTHKPRTNDLTAHLENLKHQFIGQSELCFYHATLVVLLRRNYKPKEIFAEFEQLWDAEADYLLEHLSLRWIVSACDTFVDHSTDRIRAAILMNITTLVTTLRVYETKQFLLRPPNSESLPLLDDNIEAFYRSDIPLYDGLTYFRVGSDDTLKNMRNRYESFYESDKLASTILLSVFDKLQTNNSAFSIMRLLHKSDRSKWWVD